MAQNNILSSKQSQVLLLPGMEAADLRCSFQNFYQFGSAVICFLYFLFSNPHIHGSPGQHIVFLCTSKGRHPSKYPVYNGQHGFPFIFSLRWEGRFSLFRIQPVGLPPPLILESSAFPSVNSLSPSIFLISSCLVFRLTIDNQTGTDRTNLLQDHQTVFLQGSAAFNNIYNYIG